MNKLFKIIKYINIIPHLGKIEAKPRTGKGGLSFILMSGLLIILFINLFSPIKVLADHCTVSRIAIIPGPWENTSNLISLTAQSQDETGVPCHADATIRLSFRSSTTGDFTNEGQTALPQGYISKNQSNRNFYYSSDSLESDSITVEAGYGSSSDWSVSWTVSEEVATLLSSQDDNEEENSSGGSTPPPDTSSHASPAPLSTNNISPILEIDAGRDRLVSVHSPILLKGEIFKESSISSPSFQWSFGDGGSGSGREITHTYNFPGLYQVVLNAGNEKVQAVDRLRIKVVEVSLEVSFLDQLVKIKNTGVDEINIGGWRLVSDDNDFTLAQDTIIAPGATLTLDDSLSGLKLSTVANLKFLTPDETVFWEQNKIGVGSSIDKAQVVAKLEEISKQARDIDNLLLSRRLGQLRQVSSYVVPSSASNSSGGLEVDSSSSSTATTSQKIVLIPEKTVIAKILTLPVLGVGFLGNLFQ